MNAGTLLVRGLVHHARAHAATLAGAALGCAVLVGALALGDSVRASLERAARERLGSIEAIVGNGQRYFDARRLARAVSERVGGARVAAVIQLEGVAATPGGERRADMLQVLGVEPDFFALGPGGAREPSPELLADGQALLGQELARRMDARPGDELVLRVPRPSAITRDVALVSTEDALAPLRVRVAGVLSDADFGAFSPSAGAGPASNLFVAREWLARQLDVAGRANRLLVASLPDAQALPSALGEAWELDDVGLTWKEVDSAADGFRWELTSDQVFLPEALVAAVAGHAGPVLRVFTYFVNEIRHGERATPYSMVGALEAVGGTAVPVLGGLGADGIAINSWLAQDLAASVGDELTLRYFVLGTGRALEERTHAFRVAEILDTSGLGADPTLMPAFPGLADEENCRDWDPGLPLDLAKIRDEDEEYWDVHRGAPKAFVSLASARELWSNRFGSLTALRVPAEDAAAFLRELRSGLDVGELGLALTPVSATVEASSDFGGLFLGLSCFLIVSALLLTALFFAFSVENRAAEIGTLRVAGFRARAVGALYLGEAALLLVIGIGLGSVLGLAYTSLLLRGLEAWWQGAVGRTALVFAVEPSSLVLGAGVSFVLSLAVVAWVLRRSLAFPPLRLLQGTAGFGTSVGRASPRRAVTVVLFGVALVALFLARKADGEAAAGLAFLAGFAALCGGLLAVRGVLLRDSRAVSLFALGWSNASRRRGRSLATVLLMAGAVFLLVVAGANRQQPAERDAPRDSGSGGFDFLGRTSLPVLHDIGAESGREYYGLAEDDLAGVECLALRVRAGDEASCLNLDRPRSPRLLGVDPARLTGRFRFAGALREAADPWTLLEDAEPGVVPVVVDATSLTWTLHKKLGDELELRDGGGRPFRARVVATLADSILQGDVVLSEQHFERLFPDEAGWRAFLIDAPPERAEALRARLTRALSDEGLVLVPAHERLDLLHGVQNTYLAIFQVLGGLGLALGSVGLFALVQRSAIERRGELAALRTLGFARSELCWLFLGENGALAWVGLALGAGAGTCVLVAQETAIDAAAVLSLASWIALLALSACGWVWLGTLPALRGRPSETLRRE